MAKKIRKTFTDIFELPTEAASNMPVITVTGNINIIIENYGGIVEFSDEKIVLGVLDGCMKIEGKGLDIKYMNTRCMTVDGKIGSIDFFNNGEENNNLSN